MGAALLSLAAGDLPGEQRKDARQVLEVPGQIEAREQARLFARVAGHVEKVHVDIGDRVKTGDVLADLGLPEVEAEHKQKVALVAQAEAETEQVRQGLRAAEALLAVATARVLEAEAGVAQARANLEFRKKTYDRMRELGRTGAVDEKLLDEAKQQLEAALAALAEAETKVKVAKAASDAGAAQRDRAQAEVKVAAARLEVARAEVRRVEAVLQFAKVRAPFDGFVVQRSVNTGTFAGPPSGDRAEPLFVVARLDTVRVVAALPERAVPLVKLGAPAVVRLDVYKGQEFEGKVTRTAVALDAATRTLRVEIDLPNPEGKLRPGMFGTVAFAVERPADDKPAPEKPADVGALEKARLDSAQKAFETAVKARAQGGAGASAEQLYLWSQRWLDAQRDVSAKKEDQLAAFEPHVARMKDLENLTKNLIKAGQLPLQDGFAAEFYRTDAELQLARAKAK
jgi:multidrug resistance efflux pump